MASPKLHPFVRSQSEALQKAGLKVHLGVVDNRTSPHGILRNIHRLRREIAYVQPALVHAQYGSVTAAVASASKGSRPFVISFCGDDLLGTPIAGMTWWLRGKAGRAIGIAAAHHASAIIVKSRNLLEALPQELSSKATILPNGVDTEFFYPMDRFECRRRLDWSHKAKIVLFNASHGDNASCKNPELAAHGADACIIIGTRCNNEDHVEE